ncbi:O-antigen ligase family protein [Salininema proteolyticum]|uniref:O-antigen ligase family protein n=1 Tax=Salininema proteolyticum TaxID=1607685 RepID=A0ABV8TZ38_9ACTN
MNRYGGVGQRGEPAQGSPREAASPRPSARPLELLILGYPLWWALGAGLIAVPLVALVAVHRLIRRRSIAVPPWFGLWALFLALVAVSIANLGVSPPGTVESTWIGQLPGAVFRLGFYTCVTVIALWAYNLAADRALTVERLLFLLAYWGIVTVAGGLLGTFFGGFEYTSPVEMLLPEGIRSDGFVKSLVHPMAAQTMDVLGYESPRPAAPWGYTNTWGNIAALCSAWMAAYLFTGRGVRDARRPWMWAALVLGLIPIVFSLNRALWAGLVLMAAVALLKLLVSGRLGAVLAVTALGAVAAVAVLLSPLGAVVQARFDNPHSDDGRAFSSQTAVDLTLEHSPLLGFGSTRKTLGSGESIAVGPTDDCPRCGARTLGGNGQFWQALFAHGVLGVGAYIAFFLAVLWRFRSDHSPVGIAGTACVVFSLFTMFFYNSLVTPLLVLLLGYVLLAANGDRAAERTGRATGAAA